MAKRILIMGLPGAGKTTFANELVKRLMLSSTVAWYNADTVREQYDDWDFSLDGRRRQVERMRDLGSNSASDFVIYDFVCPTHELRALLNPDVIIWMDTIQAGRFEDTNRIFEKPLKVDYHVTDWTNTWVKQIVGDLTRTQNKDSHTRSLAKAISWRVLGTIDTFVLSWVITGQAKLALTISAVEIVTKLVLYWAHERAWLKVKWGKNN